MMNKERAIKENVCSESPWREALNSLVSTPGEGFLICSPPQHFELHGEMDPYSV